MTTPAIMPDAHRFNIVIADSGPAAIEAALVLRRLAGDLIGTTILTSDEDFVHLSMTVLLPFARPGGERHLLAKLVADAGAILHRGETSIGRCRITRDSNR